MRKIKYARINIDVVLRVIILMGFSLFFYLIISIGTVKLFVHPRIVPFLEGGIVIMLIMILFILKDIFTPQRKKANVSQYLIFIIPLLMAFALPAKDVNLGTLSFGNNTNAVISDNSNIKNDNCDLCHSQNTEDVHKEDNEIDKKVIRLQHNTVVMDDSNFVKWLDAIYNNPSEYEGKKITVTGFVFKDKKFEANEFVPARMMMTCCAADMSVVGLLARYSQASELRENSWFKFTGTIENSEFNGKNIPVINIESAEKVDKPQNEYVYPY